MDLSVYLVSKDYELGQHSVCTVSKKTVFVVSSAISSKNYITFVAAPTSCSMRLEHGKGFKMEWVKLKLKNDKENRKDVKKLDRTRFRGKWRK